MLLEAACDGGEMDGGEEGGDDGADGEGTVQYPPLTISGTFIHVQP